VPSAHVLCGLTSKTNTVIKTNLKSSFKNKILNFRIKTDIKTEKSEKKVKTRNKNFKIKTRTLEMQYMQETNRYSDLQN